MGTHPIFESDFDCLTEWHCQILTKAMEAAVNQTIVTRSPYAKLREKSLMRDMIFEKITTSDEKFVWAHVEKPFTKKAAVLVGEKITEIGFEKIDIIEAEA